VERGVSFTVTVPSDVLTLVRRGVVDLPLAPLGDAEALQPGRPLRLVDPAGEPLGLAVADPENVRVRLLAAADEGVAALDGAFFAKRLARARALREALGLTGPEAAYRLVHGAGDGLSGFAVDALGRYAVLYVYARGLVTLARLLAEQLLAAGFTGVVIKVRARGAAHDKVRQEIAGEAPPERCEVVEDGLRFQVHPLGGLNVGLFTDMRAQRRRLARLAAGRRVLNGFSYTGSLSLVAARGGATEVTSVDLSSGVQAWAQDNFRLNGVDPAAHHFPVDDVGRFLDKAAREGRRWELVLLDPPAFSAARNAKWTMRSDYPDLIARAARVVSADGLLWLAANARDLDALSSLAATGLLRAGRAAALLEEGGLPADHPTLPAQPADRYLQTCLFRL
jgi:23S rRNA (cytosine1962-C5)-methyltransferase